MIWQCLLKACLSIMQWQQEPILVNRLVKCSTGLSVNVEQYPWNALSSHGWCIRCKLNNLEMLLIQPAFSDLSSGWAPISRRQKTMLLEQPKYFLFCGTSIFITVFTRTLHWTVSWAKWIQSTHSHSCYFQDQFHIILPSTFRSP
jgi:hypothetical protein